MKQNKGMGARPNSGTEDADDKGTSYKHLRQMIKGPADCPP